MRQLTNFLVYPVASLFVCLFVCSSVHLLNCSSFCLPVYQFSVYPSVHNVPAHLSISSTLFPCPFGWSLIFRKNARNTDISFLHIRTSYTHSVITLLVFFHESFRSLSVTIAFLASSTLMFYVFLSISLWFFLFFLVFHTILTALFLLFFYFITSFLHFSLIDTFNFFSEAFNRLSNLSFIILFSAL